MQGFEGQAAFGNVEGKFKFSRCISQSRVEALALWAQTGIPVKYEKEWKRMQKGIHFDKYQGWRHQIYSSLWADNHWIMSHSKMHLEQMMKELIGEADRWDL